MFRAWQRWEIEHNIDLITREPQLDSEKNYSPVEAFVWALCILDQKIRKKGKIGGQGSW